MKLFGVDVSASGLVDVVSQRLRDRGLSEDPATPNAPDVEPRVDPLSFLVQALSSHADPTQGLPVETHRDGPVGRAVVFGKQLFRRAAQGLINETLARQRVFNGHVRDGYAQLAAEVIALRRRVKELEAQAVAQPPSAPPVEASVRLSSARPTAPMPRASRAPIPPITAPFPAAPAPTPVARPVQDAPAPAPAAHPRELAAQAPVPELALPPRQPKKQAVPVAAKRPPPKAPRAKVAKPSKAPAAKAVPSKPVPPKPRKRP